MRIKESSYCTLNSSREQRLVKCSWCKIFSSEDVCEEEAFTQTIPLSAFRNISTEVAKVRIPVIILHILYLLLAMHSLHFFKFIVLLFIINIPTSGVAGFTMCQIWSLRWYPKHHFCVFISCSGIKKCTNLSDRCDIITGRNFNLLTALILTA